MKKKLIICSILCMLAVSAPSLYAAEAHTDATVDTVMTANPKNENFQAETTEVSETDSVEISGNSVTQVNAFGNRIGVYRINWEVALKVVPQNEQDTNLTDPLTENSASEADSNYITNSADAPQNASTDQSLVLELQFPFAGGKKDTLQFTFSLDIEQAIPAKQSVEIETEPTEPELPVEVIPPAETEPEKPSAAGAINETVPAINYTEDDLLWLARIIQAESGGESMESKIAVGSVILNRVESSQYPNTIYDVIFDTKYGVQFSPTKSGSIYNTPSADSYEAAKRCLEGERTDCRIIFFIMKKSAPGSWIDRTRTLIVTIGTQNFYA